MNDSYDLWPTTHKHDAIPVGEGLMYTRPSSRLHPQPCDRNKQQRKQSLRRKRR